MRKEQLMAKGLTEEHAQIAIELCREAFRGFVPKSRFDAVNERLKAANAKLKDSQAEAAAMRAYQEPEQITIRITMNGRRWNRYDD